MTKKLSEYLTDRSLRKQGIALDRGQLHALGSAWTDAAGQPLAAHVRAVRYADGCLLLAADSPVWASKLRNRPQRLIGALRRHAIFADLTGLKVRVMPVGGEAARAHTKTAARHLSPDTRKILDSVAAHIPDEALSNALRRLGRANKK